MPMGRTVGTERRRSKRIPLSVSVKIESLDHLVLFYGHCNTADVSLHGCQFFVTRPFKRGTRLLLDIRDAYHTISVHAHVVRSLPAAPGMKGMLWRVGVEITNPGNYWGVESPPPDWAL